MLAETGSRRALGCRVPHLTAIWSGRMSTPPAFPSCQRDPKGGQWGGCMAWPAWRVWAGRPADRAQRPDAPWNCPQSPGSSGAHREGHQGETDRSCLQAEPRPGPQPSFCCFQTTGLRGGPQGHLSHSPLPPLSPWPETGHLDLNSYSSRQAQGLTNADLGVPWGTPCLPGPQKQGFLGGFGITAWVFEVRSLSQRG